MNAQLLKSDYWLIPAIGPVTALATASAAPVPPVG
jgi:hypothetical protein